MIQKILNTEEICYTSNFIKENLRKKIEELFEQKALRLVVRFTNENEFVAYDTNAVIGWDVPNLKRRGAYLEGKIEKKEEVTLIKLKVKPNALLPIFAIVSLVLGVTIAILAMLSSEGDKFFLMLGNTLIALCLVYYPISTFLKNKLKSKVVKHLDLRAI